jgi:hypothetical protein
MPVLKAEDGSDIVDDKGKAIAFNSYFASVLTKDDYKQSFLGSECTNNLTSCRFPELRVYEHLKRLKSKTSHGPDGIPNVFLKRMRFAVAAPLASIFTVSFETGDVPSDWKIACIKPLPKSAGYSPNIKDYRPISLTSSVCKLMESMLRESLLDHCFLNNVFCPQQFGFLPRRSAEGQLLSCVNDWTASLDMKIPVDVIYLDFAKAFDSVAHSNLNCFIN